MLMKVADMGEHIWSLQPMGDSDMDIPECWGMHGVHQSGLREFQAGVLLERALHEAILSWGQRAISTKALSKKSGIQCEDGGIKLCRPLMPFPKQRLQATCQKHRVDWIEDETNLDIKLTPRNAVRSLLQNNRLPRALAKNSLLILAKNMTDKIRGYETRAETLLRHTKILSLDLRSGCLTVRFPQRLLSINPMPDKFVTKSLSSVRTKATFFLTKFLSIVTPRENIKLSSVHAVTELIFPELLGPATPLKGADLSAPKFTIGGVLVQRLEAPMDTRDSENAAISTHKRDLLLDPEFTWSFTREPFRRSELRQLTIGPYRRDTPIKPKQQTSFLRVNNTAWHLWDGRYWISLMNPRGSELMVRPFQRGDFQAFEEDMPSSQFAAFRDQLRTVAPGDIRWTLPVIAEATGSERPLALPTLQYKSGSFPHDLRWEIRYKKIHLRGEQDTNYIIR